VTTAAELEEQEEVRWGKRTQQMAHLISRAMTTDHSKSVTLQQLLHHNNRKQAASKFYTMLVLKKAHAVEVRQAEMFGEITISQGSRFDQVMV
jgi:cohesin complex subunit SCC1